MRHRTVRAFAIPLLVALTTLPGGNYSLAAGDSGPAAPWVRHLVGPGEAHSVAATPNGSAIYVAGRTRGAFGADPKPWLDDYPFLIRYDPRGHRIWTRILTTAPRNSEATSVAIDDSGIYIVGGWSGGFLAKYSPAGDLLWTQTFGDGVAQPRSVASDGTSVYIAGSTSGPFGGQTPPPGAESFLVRYSIDGALQWVRIFGAEWDNRATSVATTGSAIYVAGAADGSFGGQTNPHRGFEAPYLVQYNPAGDVVWTRIFGGTETVDNTPGSDYASDVAADSSGAYVVGFVYGTFEGQGTADQENGFLRRFTTDGSTGWTRVGQNAGETYSLNEDATGIDKVSRGWDGTVDRFRLDGHELWSRTISGINGVSLWGIASAPTGVFVAGASYPGDFNRVLVAGFPAPQVQVVGGSAYTRDRTVRVALFAVDAPQMELALNPTFSGSAWVPYAETASVHIASADGPKTIYLRLKGSDGKVSPVVSTSIVLDTTAPASSVAQLPSKRHEPFTVSWSGSDATSGIHSYEVQFKYQGSGAWRDWFATTSQTHASFSGNVGKTACFRVRATDNAGNVEPWPAHADTCTKVKRPRS